MIPDRKITSFFMFAADCFGQEITSLKQQGREGEYRFRQRGCSLTHSARTPLAVHQGITIWVDEIEFEKK